MRLCEAFGVSRRVLDSIKSGVQEAAKDSRLDDPLKGPGGTDMTQVVGTLSPVKEILQRLAFGSYRGTAIGRISGVDALRLAG